MCLGLVNVHSILKSQFVDRRNVNNVHWHLDTEDRRVISKRTISIKGFETFIGAIPVTPCNFSGKTNNRHIGNIHTRSDICCLFHGRHANKKTTKCSTLINRSHKPRRFRILISGYAISGWISMKPAIHSHPIMLCTFMSPLLN